MSLLDWETQKSSGMDLWVEERHRKDYYATRFKCKKVLFSAKTNYQHIDVIDTEAYGHILLNDGIIQLSEKDEFVYHEMMAHVPLFTHPKPENVLIIGGGDGGVAREVLRHDSVKQCTLVDIDEVVVQVSKKYFPSMSPVFNNPKLKLKIEDGVQFIKNTNEKFDIILVDSTDPIGPASALFAKKFYEEISSTLNSEGLVVVQAESSFFEIKTQALILQCFHSLFPVSQLYHFSNMVYPGGLWSFALGSKRFHPIKDVQKEKNSCTGWDLCYYNPKIHQSAFSQPEFVKKELGQWVKG